MTQDCSITLSIADESHSPQGKCFPKGIHITEPDEPSGLGIEGMSGGEEDVRPWGYLLVHNMQVATFKKRVEAYNLAHPEHPHPCFVHYSYRYRQKASGKGVEKKQLPTVSGLVFLQGQTDELQAFLRTHYPQYHLVNNCSTGRPACIAHRLMRPFMEVVATHPENVTFLREPFLKFASNHVRLRVLTGLFKGLEGYIVRVDRDRQLVMELGGYAVAIGGVHREDFEVVE